MSVAFGHRAVLKIKHVPEQLTDVVFIPVLFTLMFTYLFGGALAGSTGEYLQFLLPGTLVMTVLMVSTFTGTSLHTDVNSGVFDRFRSMPVWRPAPIAGALIGDAGRYAISATIVAALGLLMGFRPEDGAAGVLLAVGLLLVFSFALAWVWATVALAVRSPNAVTTTSLLIVFPLSFASNVFVDPATMPGWLRAFVDVNPVSHLVTAARGLMAGNADSGEVLYVVVAAAVLTAVFGPLTMHLYGRKG
jgi:ABC-2 type transport system permease protein